MSLVFKANLLLSVCLPRSSKGKQNFELFLQMAYLLQESVIVVGFLEPFPS